jgi:1-phosphofructokinase family hexose kinase
LVVALNPSVDVEWRLDLVRPEEKNVVRSIRRWPGGKGVNVARWLLHLGSPARLLLPLGGAPGRELSAGLKLWNIPIRSVRIRESSRVNVIVTPDQGPQIRFNEAGPVLSRSDWQATQSLIARELEAASVLVLSGSLPRGIPSSAYRQLIQLARRAEVPCILDCEGASLKLALSARPFLVKPNEHELADWAGTALPTEESVLGAATRLSSQTQGWVFVSRGRQGALLVHSGHGVTLRALPPVVRVQNTVGAGDALLSAVTSRLALGEPPEAWLRWGVATGTVMATKPAGVLPSTASIARMVARIPACV